MFAPEILCVFGRGIEQVGTPFAIRWRPTRYIERLHPETNGHPGTRVAGITPEDDDPLVVIAGANANALAAAHLYDSLRKEGMTPKIVVFAAGRPAYLADAPDMWEGKPLSERFKRTAKLAPETEIRFQRDNRNTRDDLLETMRLAKEKGLSRIGIISVAVHLPRCREFLAFALKEDASYGALQIRFFASEEILFGRDPRYHRILCHAMRSKAHARTREKEEKGIRDLRSGRYDLGPSGHGYGFARKNS